LAFSSFGVNRPGVLAQRFLAGVVGLDLDDLLHSMSITIFNMRNAMDIGSVALANRRWADQVDCGARTLDESTCSTSKGCVSRSM
jgi:hypothetical protein